MRALLILGLFWINLSFSQDFFIDHESCQVHIFKTVGTDYPELFETLLENLKKRNYIPKVVAKSYVFTPRDLYLEFSKKMEGFFFFPACLVKIEIKETKRDRITKEDGFFFSQVTKRAFPRHTPKGTYRCKLGIRDVFYHLPHCRKKAKGF